MYNHQRFNNTCSDGQTQYLKVLLVIYAHYGGWGGMGEG